MYLLRVKILLKGMLALCFLQKSRPMPAQHVYALIPAKPFQHATYEPVLKKQVPIGAINCLFGVVIYVVNTGTAPVCCIRLSRSPRDVKVVLKKIMRNMKILT